jgi:hypothetical protein
MCHHQRSPYNAAVVTFILYVAKALVYKPKHVPSNENKSNLFSNEVVLGEKIPVLSDYKTRRGNKPKDYHPRRPEPSTTPL